MKFDPTLHEPRVIENISPNTMKRTASFFWMWVFWHLCIHYGLFGGGHPFLNYFQPRAWNFRISMDLNVSTLVKLHTH